MAAHEPLSRSHTVLRSAPHAVHHAAPHHAHHRAHAHHHHPPHEEPRSQSRLVRLGQDLLPWVVALLGLLGATALFMAPAAA